MDDDGRDDRVADTAARFGMRDRGGRGNAGAMTVAIEVWVVTALLHREQPDADDFSAAEIVARAEREQLCGPRLRAGFSVNVNQHCVANRAPNPARLRFLYETGRGRRRLFRGGDPYEPRREGSRTVPGRDELPDRFKPLIDWYEKEYAMPNADAAMRDPILGLRGLGRSIRGKEDPDDYVRRLRAGWS